VARTGATWDLGFDRRRRAVVAGCRDRCRGRRDDEALATFVFATAGDVAAATAEEPGAAAAGMGPGDVIADVDAVCGRSVR
jgi:hypothetical protein